MANDKTERFRGGKKTARDRLFGIGDKDFWRWRHRRDKGRTGDSGNDVDDTKVAEALYEEWVRLGRPKSD